MFSLRTIALDIGQCCVQLDRPAFYRTLNIEPTVSLIQSFETSLHLLETSQIDVPEFYRQIRQAFGINPTDQELRLAMNSTLGTQMPGMLPLLQKMTRQGIKICFFSDISVIHQDGFFSLCPEIHACSSGGVYSFEAGATKPGKPMYDLFEQRYGKPDLYIDDRADNILAGRQAGWRSWQFTSVQDLWAFLQQESDLRL